MSCTDRERTSTPPGSWSPFRLTRQAVIGLLSVLGIALPTGRAAATTADDLCAAGADPCTVTRSVSVTPNSVIDVGDRTLVIANRGALDLQSGIMTIRAGVLNVQAGGALLGRGNRQTSGAVINVDADEITIAGNIDANGAPGGAVTLTSQGPLVLTGPLEVRSLGMESGGGSAELTAVDITINGGGRIDARGGSDDDGGIIDITASGALIVAGDLNALGGEGGTVTLSSGGNMNLVSGTITAEASSSGGSGGDITIDAAGVATIGAELLASGRNGSSEIGAGDGGTVEVSGSAVAVTANVRVLANAGSPDGVGGDVDVSSTLGAIDFQARIEVRGPGMDTSGGTISIDALGAAAIGGVFDARGGRDGGGTIDLLSNETMMINQSASLNVSAESSGNGGDIDTDANGNLTVRGTLTADGGPTEGGGGGTVTLRGCAVRIENGARVSSLRTAGTNTVVGRDSTIVAGVMAADVGSGRNVFRFAGPDYDPAFLPGSDVRPGPTLIEDGTVLPCNPLPTRTPTFTHTAGPSPTATATRRPTNTPTPDDPACVGDCDNSGVVTITDLIIGVNIVIGNQPVSACPAFDPDGSGTVLINELIQGVNNLLAGCP